MPNSTPTYGITFPIAGDLIKDDSVEAKLASQLQVLATTADQAIDTAKQAAINDATTKYGGLSERIYRMASAEDLAVTVRLNWRGDRTLSPITDEISDALVATVELAPVEPVTVAKVGANGKIDSSLIPAGSSFDDTGVAALVDQPTSKTRMAIGKTFGGRYVITAPEFGGIGDGVTDNTDAWNRVMNAASATGGEVFVPQGVFRIDGATVPVPGGVTLRGTGMSYSAPEDGPQQRASVIRAGTTMARLIELGADPHVSTAGLAGAQMRDIIADGRDLANVVVIPNGRRWLIDHCQVYWGALIGVEVLGQNGDLTGNSVVAQNNTGSCVVLRHEPDNKVTGNQLRQAGPEGACLLVQPLGSSQLGTGNIVIQNNHMWLGQNGVPTAGHLIKVDLNASKTEGGMQIVGNQLEGCLGDQIFFNVADSSRCYSTLISSNRFFQNPSLTDNTFSVLGMSGTGTVSDLNMSSNQFSAYSTSRRWRSLVHDYGTGPRDRIMVDANQVRRAVQPWTTAAASTWIGPEPGLNVGLGADGAEWRTRHYGTTTVTGDGTTRVFTLATGLSFPTARILNVTPRSAAAGASHYASMAGGTLTVEFATAPAAAQPITFTYDLWR